MGYSNTAPWVNSVALLVYVLGKHLTGLRHSASYPFEVLL